MPWLLAAAVLHLVNGERVKHHEQPLRVSAALRREAESHRGMANTSVRACGPVWGQNVAWGSLSDASPRMIVAAWMASPPHRSNLLDPAYRFTGIAAYKNGPVTFVTQDFAQECH